MKIGNQEIKNMKKKCNQCGRCCKEELCQMAEMAGLTDLPCDFLIYENGKYWCKLIKTEKNFGLEPLLAEAIGIGKGCCADFK